MFPQPFLSLITSPGKELTQYRGLYIILNVMFNESSDWKNEFMLFANYYYDEFPNFNGLDAELELWFKLWRCEKFKNNFLILFL